MKTIIDSSKIGKRGYPRHYQALGLEPPTKTVPVVDDQPQSNHPGLTPEQITELEWSAFRTERDARLSACDWTQLPDAPLTDEQREAWAEYRQLLRDLPDSTDNPAEPNWPEQPI